MNKNKQFIECGECGESVNFERFSPTTGPTPSGTWTARCGCSSASYVPGETGYYIEESPHTNFVEYSPEDGEKLPDHWNENPENYCRVVNHKLPNANVDVWVDRRSRWGNPFKKGDFEDEFGEAWRDLVCDLYQVWFNYKIRGEEFREETKKLAGKDIACAGCKGGDKRCHAHTIARWVNEYSENQAN